MSKPDRKVDVIICDNPDKSINMQDVQWSSEHCSIIHLQSPGGKDACDLIKLYQSQGKKVLIDYDDFSFDLSPGNPRYADLGIKECDFEDASGKTVFKWRDGENGFNLALNISKYNEFINAVKMADCVTTTTDYLAKKFTAIGAKTVICPNSIDLERWRPMRRPSRLDGQVRIGWFGGDSHYSDLQVFAEIIPVILRKYPQVKFVLQCPPVPEWKELFKHLPEDRVEWFNWTDLKYYPLFLASRHWDIGLCPLDTTADIEFNRCKSSIKWMEFVAIGAAVVAQDMTPYADTITRNKTGLLAGSADEWIKCISILVEDPIRRAKMASDAMDELKANHNLDINCLAWQRAYLDVLEN